MVVIIGASSLYHSFQKQQYHNIRRRLSKEVICYPGLNFHPEAAKEKTRAQNFIKGVKSEVIIWHDVINNTTTEFKKDSRNPLTAPELVEEIKKLPQIVGLIYCQRQGAPNILDHLRRSTAIPVLDITTDLISKRKQKDKKLLSEYKSLHQKAFLEIKTLTTIRNKGYNLKAFLKKKKKPSKKQREAARRRKAEQ